ncbi:MAG: Pyruvate synthase subunit PorB [Candidatus Moranbacteria bacterium GW2011_GWC2_37_73]|nr:MAG: Pyruvate synthase subunit PorB [Parcubacteria group bacterium GW2011_GWC1_36_108]KKQ00852.1 MAG: Pyruvate synthase subunit PorB [Candidatus Moranbacteria bacterium GW2011_GWD1_36_198]KKQ02285.1 MAG: Pyruvate synthase subunit PorB [Candidatus Moranbacteria bacterium GW2011_GWD2_36_198]KKQ39987.1 MAG: Pyruvate synthase subunit PorB [Candidatus Moranbacteria bacterium GW2011_GWC2_37_73]HAR99854.1 pyruvate ferredoxin oxidoreductase [Candidatus Moranbacteria bacterium]
MNKELTKKLSSGHATCQGCGIPAIVRTVLGATDEPVIVANATGCLEVTTTIYPYTAWKVPYVHSVFGNAAATAAGIDAAQKALMKSGKIKKKAKVVVFGGDGGTYDIGLQALSGALERGHDFLYVCYDNEGYMNTGGQRSGGTPYGANTETAPAGETSFGKSQQRKDLMEIVNAHHIKYLAQSNVAYVNDLKMKAKKALKTTGPSFLLVLQPCTQLWKFPTSEYVAVGKLATETNFWPLYEIEDGKYTINNIVKTPKPIEEFLKVQGRFKHLFTDKNKQVIVDIQNKVDENLSKLVKRAEKS